MTRSNSLTRTSSPSSTSTPATQTASPSETASASPQPVLLEELWGVIDKSQWGDGVTVAPQILLRDQSNNELYLQLPLFADCSGGCPVTTAIDLFNAWYTGSAYYPNVVTQGSQDPTYVTVQPNKDFISYWTHVHLALSSPVMATFGGQTLSAYNVTIDLFDHFGSTDLVTDPQANNDR